MVIIIGQRHGKRISDEMNDFRVSSVRHQDSLHFSDVAIEIGRFLHVDDPPFQMEHVGTKRLVQEGSRQLNRPPTLFWNSESKPFVVDHVQVLDGMGAKAAGKDESRFVVVDHQDGVSIWGLVVATVEDVGRRLGVQHVARWFDPSPVPTAQHSEVNEH